MLHRNNIIGIKARSIDMSNFCNELKSLVSKLCWRDLLVTKGRRDLAPNLVGSTLTITKKIQYMYIYESEINNYMINMLYI